MEPAGVVIPFAGSTAPQGYLLCDGSAVARDTYSALFAAIGTVYGSGDGSTTFNVPDLSGRVVLGVSQSHALGSTGGEATHVLTEQELPAHSHTVPAHTHENDITATTPVLTHSITQPVFKYNKPNQSNTAGSGDSCIVNVTTATASRSANLAVSNHTSAACTMSGSVTSKAPFNTGSTGLGAAHNNMQPYTTVCYIISTGV